MRYLSLILVLALPSLANGFTLVSSRVKFNSDKVTVHVAGNSCANNGLSPSSILEITKAALERTWNAVSTANMELEMGEVKSGIDVSGASSTFPAAQQTDGDTIIVGCNSTLFTSETTLAVGNIFDINGSVRGAVLINDEIINSTNLVAGLSQADLEAVMAHELGHALGIGHSSDATALMYYSIGNKVQDKLSQDDWDALTYLYPYSAPGGCASVAIIPNKNDRLTPLMLSLILGFMMSFLGLRMPKKKTSRF